ncbi:hypothetical protein [Poseidonocella sp. HB161398]|uniref:hypothetical protein n=1 Tax=Poseidonocella sp. HB161398 TaxID=2320855 RepID=UPI001109AA7A|nr:hypothetical protein [Poseidonocella sp. HB161398]
MAEPAPDQLAAQALVRAWRKGRTGQFAAAEILGAPGGIDTALCFATVRGRAVPLGTPFACRIEKGPKGWKVVELLSGEGLEDLGALPLAIRHAGRYLRAEAEHDGTVHDALLPRPVLWAAGLAEICDGAGIEGRLGTDRSGRLVVEAVTAPCQADILPPGPAAPGEAQRCALYMPVLAFDAAKGAGRLAGWSEELGVAFSVPVQKFHLERIGQRRLAKWQGGGIGQESLGESYAALSGDGPAEAPDLVWADLVWSAEDARWSLSGLRGPEGAHGLPGRPGDRHDWIGAEVTAAALRLAPPEEAAEDSGAVRAPRLARQSHVTLGLQIGGREVEARLYPKAHMVWLCEALTVGRQVIVALERREAFWAAVHLHRVLPR